MRSALVALVLVFVPVAGCTPDGEAYPIQPGSTNVPALGGVAGGGFGEGSGDVVPDAGTGSGDLDGGVTLNDAGPFFDAPPPDAAALLPDAQTDFPPFP
jgi:hypothetical protein